MTRGPLHRISIGPNEYLSTRCTLRPILALATSISKGVLASIEYTLYLFYTLDAICCQCPAETEQHPWHNLSCPFPGGMDDRDVVEPGWVLMSPYPLEPGMHSGVPVSISKPDLSWPMHAVDEQCEQTLL